MLKFCYTFVLLLSFGTLCAKENYVSGYVSDIQSRTRIGNAIIHDSITGNHYLTNKQGFFSIPVFTQKVNFSIFSADHKLVSFRDSIAHDTSVFFQLFQEASKCKCEHNNDKLIRINTLRTRNNNMHFENSILMNQKHLMRMFDYIDPEIAYITTEHSINRPARFSNYLYDVQNISFIEGSKRKLKFSGELGTHQLKGLLQVPLQEQTSWVLGARKSATDVWQPTVLEAGLPSNADFEYGWYDVYSSINHRFTPNHEFSANFFRTHDAHRLQTTGDKNALAKTAPEWSNSLFTAQWSQKIFSNLYGKVKYGYSNQYQDIQEALRWQNLNQSQHHTLSSTHHSLNIDVDYFRESHYVKFGIFFLNQEFLSERALFNAQLSDQTVSYEHKEENELFEIYAEDNYSILNFIDFNLGIRLSSYFYANNKVYSSLQPRFSINFKFSEDFSTYLAFSQINSYFQKINNNNVFAPVLSYLPSNGAIHPEKSLLFNFGIKYEFLENLYIQVGTDARRYNNVSEFEEGVNSLVPLNNTADLSQSVQQADATQLLYRIDVDKTGGDFQMRLKYTYSDHSLNYLEAERLNPNLNGGLPYTDLMPHHEFAGIASYQLSSQYKLNLAYSMHSGYQVSANNFSTKGLTGKTFQPSPKNAETLGEYSRLDIGLAYLTQVGAFKTEFELKIFNLFNKFNTSTILPNIAGTHTSFKEYNFVPFLPMFSCKFSL